jgi:thiol-disulfide isomerase/thioredoxin
MRTPSLYRGLLILPLCMFGCSQNWTVRKPPGDDVKTVASVGDNSLPIRSGTPDSSVRAQDTEPIIPTPSRGRISGRVYDERGKPVPGAKVRLAVGGESGGKAVSSVTDRSGAFTLRGVRPGSSYTVIAEYEGENGLMAGRVEAEAPDTDVRIGLQRRAADGDDVRTTIRPARPNVAPISNVEDSDEAENAGPLSARTGRDDLEPPAPEAEALRGNGSGSRPAPRISSSAGSSGKSSGWSQGHRSVGGSAAGQGGASGSGSGTGSAEGSSRASRASKETDGDDEVNPLPPALEPGKVGATQEPEDAPDHSIALARGQASSQGQRRRASAMRSTPAVAADAGLDDDRATPDQSAPQPLPQGVVAGARSVEPDGYAPLRMSDPEALSRKPASSSRPATRDLQEPSASLPPRPGRAVPPTEPTRPTWGELAFKKEPIPLDESLQKVSRDLAVKGTRGGADEGLKAAVKTAASSAPGLAALAAGTKVTCQFNPEEPRLVDFRLPDVEGRMVSFHDFDADLILLDFWGTWCAPCRKSVAHLIEIQQTLGGKKVQVVGIACERTPAKDRAANVAKSLKELKINYPVLISSMDGTCPVQDAFQIQFYPTLVLVDRRGRVLWREQGATDVTLARMDRFILKNLNHTSTTGEDALQARVARAAN